MKKILMLFMGLILAAGVFLFLSKDWLLKAAAETAVTKATGFPTGIAKLRVDFPSTILVEGLRIRNPAGFEEKLFADVPEIYVDLVLDELLRGERIHLRTIRLRIAEVHIERNAKGVSNAALLSSAGSAPSEKKAKAAARGQKEKPGIPFQLDRLELTMRQVSFQDRSGLLSQGVIPGGMVPKRFDVGGVLSKGVQTFSKGTGRLAKEVVPSEIAQKKMTVDLRVEKEVFADIRDPMALVNLVLLKIAYGTTFGNLAGLKPEMLQTRVQGAVGSGGRFLKQAAGEFAGGVVNGAKTRITSLFGDSKSA